MAVVGEMRNACRTFVRKFKGRSKVSVQVGVQY
jgi:hypothetical protein